MWFTEQILTGTAWFASSGVTCEACIQRIYIYTTPITLCLMETTKLHQSRARLPLLNIYADRCKNIFINKNISGN